MRAERAGECRKGCTEGVGKSRASLCIGAKGTVGAVSCGEAGFFDRTRQAIDRGVIDISTWGR